MGASFQRQIAIQATTSEPCHTVRRPLPEGRNRNGRPVWKAPVLDYGELIDKEDYEKKREAVLKHYKGDVVKTTRYFDLATEKEVINKYIIGAGEEGNHARIEGNEKEYSFFMGLWAELSKDEHPVYEKYMALHIRTTRAAEGLRVVDTLAIARHAASQASLEMRSVQANNHADSDYAPRIIKSQPPSL